MLKLTYWTKSQTLTWEGVVNESSGTSSYCN